MKFKDLFPNFDEKYRLELEKQLKNFPCSFMNNAKWQKVFIKIFENRTLIKHCQIVDLCNATLNNLHLNEVVADVEAFIFEDFISDRLTTSEYPTLYKSIHYISFLKSWNENGMQKEQNTQEIEQYLSNFGVFTFEETEKDLRLLGYR